MTKQAVNSSSCHSNKKYILIRFSPECCHSISSIKLTRPRKRNNETKISIEKKRADDDDVASFLMGHESIRNSRWNSCLLLTITKRKSRLPSNVAWIINCFITSNRQISLTASSSTKTRCFGTLFNEFNQFHIQIMLLVLNGM